MEDLVPIKFRSRINQLPKELRVKIGEVSFQKQMYPPQRRTLIIDLLRDYDIEFTELGTGTNRFIIKYDGYALKIALDQEGVADNRQEYVMSPLLAPYVSPAHEISLGGHLLVASYAPAFTSFQDMRCHENAIREILKSWAANYLLGDVGITSINYANWGMLNGKPVCIDYAYIFPTSMDLFSCVDCGNKAMKFTGNDYTKYQCTVCQKVYDDREIRSRISNQERLKLFSDVSGNSIKLLKPIEERMGPPLKSQHVDPFMPDPRDIAAAVVDRYYGGGSYGV